MKGSTLRPSKGVLTKPAGGGVNQPKAAAVSKPGGRGPPQKRQPSAGSGGSGSSRCRTPSSIEQ